MDSSKNIFIIIAAFILGIASIVIYSVGVVSKLNLEINDMVHQAHLMELKADELRQSSDDLTRFAREYVVTGNVTFLENYYSVLAIRKGEKAHPHRYQQIYWDLLEPTRSLRHPDTALTISLRNEMKVLPFSDYEFSKLKESEDNSNQLVKIEEQAFFNMQNQQQELAISLLFNQQYSEAKQSIMLPIDEFMVSLHSRRQQVINDGHNEMTANFKVITFLLVVGILLFIAFLYVLIISMQRNYQAMKALSNIDPLTKIRNRRSLFLLAEQAMQESNRNQAPLSMMMIDIDLFKGINDTYGHIVGDEILLDLVARLKQKIRKSDLLSRYGGEEFILLLPETDLAGATKLAENICSAIDDQVYQNETLSVAYTISIGVSQYQHEKLVREFIHKTDQALYQAKGSGRNQVKVFSPAS
ncbi:hypothetical protein A9Q78_11800 [Methylophaga sp. 41_12_T18]|nr:hypothetical protein A9Q78_11800 [Methylophaga sp. 41_12_T18]